jgi:hypothetical protein
MANEKKPQVKPDVTTSNKPFTFADAMALAKSGVSGNASTGAVYTAQDADAAVQGIWQQLFGKNAMGADYAKAVSLYTNQSQDTGEAGRVQAVQNYAQSTQEYQGMQEDRYLDAIYATIQANVRKAQV